MTICMIEILQLTKQLISKNHTKKTQSPNTTGKKKGLNPPAMRSATTKQKKDQFGFHNFLFVIKLPLPLVLPAVGFNSMKIIYCIHMALQVFSGFETKKGTWQCSPRPMLQLPWRWVESMSYISLQFSDISQSSCLRMSHKNAIWKRVRKKGNSRITLQKLFLLPRLSLDHHLITSSWSVNQTLSKQMSYQKCSENDPVSCQKRTPSKFTLDWAIA